MKSHALTTDSYLGARSARTVLKYSIATSLVIFGLSACAGTEVAGEPIAAAAGEVAEGAVPSADLCRFLKTELSQLKSASSEGGARVQYATDIFAFFQKHGDAIPDGGQIDEQTKQACPDIRAEMLKVTGSKSFAEI
ncbi:hypothetical protein ACWKSP_23860 [Micromonosporaceae bacterium Da 78-11]